MTDAEWPVFCAEIEMTFRGGLEDDREVALREHFGRVPYDLARRCVARLVLDGQVFTPTPGECVSALRKVTGGRHAAFRAALDGETTEARTARLESERARRLALLERNAP